jgi:hypothetical protein
VGFFDGRVVGTIDWSEGAVPGDAALEFGRHFVHRCFFEWVGATATEKGGGDEKENDR